MHLHFDRNGEPISLEEWAANLERDRRVALAYANLLMLQPDRVNWVRTDWIWL